MEGSQLGLQLLLRRRLCALSRQRDALRHLQHTHVALKRVAAKQHAKEGPRVHHGHVGHAGGAKAVVSRPLFGVRQHLVGVAQLLRLGGLEVGPGVIEVR